MRLLVIDNRDSFTWNLVEYLAGLTGLEPEVVDHHAPVPDFTRYDAVVISPGPGTPERPADVGISVDALHSGLPVLGVCLGHQLMALESGARIVRAPEPVHGRVDEVTHAGAGLFDALPSPLPVVRYHSLVAVDLPPSLEVTAVTPEGLVMALRHREKPWWGVQFHPESVGADGGMQVLANFLAQIRPVLHTRVLPGAVDTAAAFTALYGAEPEAVWLDDATGTGVSYLGVPARTLSAPGAEAFETMSAELRHRPHDPELGLDFQLGWVGWFGYECDPRAGFESPLPDSWWARLDSAIAVDHAHDRTVLLHLGEGAQEWFDDVASALRDLEPVPVPAAPGVAVPPHPREPYLEAIAQAQELIAAGETYEVCLTTTIAVDVELDPLAAHLRLRAAHPSRFGGYLRAGDVALASATPETFLRIDADGVVSTRPIKGTRARGADAAEDEALRADLAGNPKDRSENLMIVDLARNDLAHHAVRGSVHAGPLFEVETHPGAHQLVSTVSARLWPGTDPLDVIRDAFPGGSMTGAPKTRTMEIINRLETGARGPYSGAFGYLSDTGTVDLAMVIRTAVVEPGRVTYGVGGAILALSDPEEEYRETLTKARPLRDLLEG